MTTMKAKTLEANTVKANTVKANTVKSRARMLTRWGNAALVVGLVTSTVSASLLLIPEPASAASIAPVASSAVTVAWATSHTDPTSLDYARFADLSVTVSQTANLTNQGIRLNWTGGKPTSPGQFATDYLQVMQCWGEATSGPTPEQCQWGAPNTAISTLMGTKTSGRSLEETGDPNQTFTPDLRLPVTRVNPDLRAWAYPFVSVKGVRNFDVASFFSPQTTNEVSAVRTGLDGTGSVAFETQTSLEAPHLGCGGAVEGSSAPRSCWLVIVPRGQHNADGTPASTDASGRVVGSPLSATNWANRMVVKLQFQPVASSCPLGNAERRVVGTEVVSEALTSWQPALCTETTTFGFSQIGDSEARSQIVTDISGGSKLGFFADPLSAAQVGEKKLVYAPVTQSAIVVAYSIDFDLISTATNYSSNGTEATSLTLNPRLVAKLLTQSYRYDVPGGGNGVPASSVITANPRSILNDPEFVALNPAFAGFTSLSAPEGLMVALGSSDASAHVWSWLRSDPLANSFLAGYSDEWGMTINPQYKSLALSGSATTDSFPKADLSTYQATPDVPLPGFGTLDMRPYMNDMHEAAYRALRADANVKTTWDPINKTPPAFVSGGAQLPGHHFALALTDSASAARYGLHTARLINGAGQAVALTDATLLKGIATMKASAVTGVKVADPSARVLGAYPLTMLTYAGVNACAATPQEIADYSDLLAFATGAGQVAGDARGQLPRGYVPLDTASVKQTQASVATLKASVGGKGICAPTAAVATTPPPTEAPTLAQTANDSGTSVITAVPTADPEEVKATIVSGKTVDQQLPPSRLGLAAALALGIPTMIVGPFLTRRGRRLASLEEIG